MKNIETLKFRNNWTSVKPLNKGWSKDIKYYIEDDQNTKLLLRVSDKQFYDKKLEQFNLLKEVLKLNINAPVPIEFGTFDETSVYMLLTWVEGDDAAIVIPTLDEKTQYQLGVEAGLILKRLHRIPITSDLTWNEIYKNKIPKKIKKAKEAPIQHQYLDRFINYVLENMHIVENNPVMFQHGDYHLGNMVITKELKLGIIDFDKMDKADPIDDFKPFVWNVLKSPAFETGLIDGYYENNPPESFFRTLALYAAESCIAHISWAIGFGSEEVKTAISVADKIYHWYQGFNLIIPSWYDQMLKEKYKSNK